MDPTHRKKVARLLGFLIAVDLGLTLVGFAWPELWFRLIHGTPADDPQRFLQRTAAAWLVFLGLQVVAYVRFSRDPVWLAVIAGVRLSDMLADWTHAIFAADVSTLGYACLLSASPVNALAGMFLLSAYRKADEECLRAHPHAGGHHPCPRSPHPQSYTRGGAP